MAPNQVQRDGPCVRDMCQPMIKCSLASGSQCSGSRGTVRVRQGLGLG